MLPAELTPISPGIWLWQHYDSAVKTDFFSTALQTASGLYIIDPTPLPQDQLKSLQEAGPVAGVIVTNANHKRSAPVWSEQFRVPVFARKIAFPQFRAGGWVEPGGGKIGSDLEVVEIEGAAPGEMAIYHPGNGGSWVMGDALINFEPYGFTFLPKKYCEDEKKMRRSLRQLLTRPAERMLFAHGTPIMAGAMERLRQLLVSE